MLFSSVPAWPVRADAKQLGRVAVLSMAALLSALALSACGAKKDKDKAASQTAAKVNKEEITVHQINYVLAQQRGLAPDQAASASKAALERLVDQELALQKAQEQKLDRDPRVVQQLEAARRDIIARAYFEKISAGAPKPTPAEVQAYYDAHPALFSARRVYNLQELNIQAKPDQLVAMRAKLAATKDMMELTDYLKANDIKFTANQATRSAEQLPLASLDKFAEMKDGQSIVNLTPAGAQLVLLVSSRSQPVDLDHAVPAIEQFLLNERKRKLVEDDLRALRSSSKIEYVGDYAKGGAREIQPGAAPASDAPPVTSLAPTIAPSSSAPIAAPQIEVEPITTAPASAPSAKVLEKGIKGFK